MHKRTAKNLQWSILHCDKCEAEIPWDAEVCKNCGHKLMESVLPTSPGMFPMPRSSRLPQRQPHHEGVGTSWRSIKAVATSVLRVLKWGKRWSMKAAAIASLNGAKDY